MWKLSDIVSMREVGLVVVTLLATVRTSWKVRIYYINERGFDDSLLQTTVPNITIKINFNAHALSNSCLDMFSVLSHEYKFSCLFRIARWKQKLLVVMMKGNKLWTQNYLKYVIFVNILCFFMFANAGAFTIVKQGLECFFFIFISDWYSDSRGYNIQMQTGWSQWLGGAIS